MPTSREERTSNNDRDTLIGRRPSGRYRHPDRASGSRHAHWNPTFVWLLWRHHEIFDPDRKPSQANARRVPDCIRDRAGRARDADLTNALYTKSVHVRIVLLDNDRVQAWYVGVHWDMVFGEVRVDDPAGTVIADGPLVKRERYAPDHPAIDLTADHTRIDHATRRECTYKTGGADLTEIRIDLDLGENGAVRVHGIGRLRDRV